MSKRTAIVVTRAVSLKDAALLRHDCLRMAVSPSAGRLALALLFRRLHGADR